jgi:hypothetical protein
MRREIFFLFVFMITLVSSSPTLIFQNEEIQPGETILAKITAEEFAEQIKKSDITFYEGRRNIFLESDIMFYGGNHYLYIYPTKEGNFSIEIKNILYKESGQLKSSTITKNFEIKTNPFLEEETNNTFIKILTIKPGLFFTSQQPILKITNTGNISTNVTVEEKSYEIEPEETKQIQYSPNKTFSELKIFSYKLFSIPIVYTGELRNETPQANETQNETQNETVETTENETAVENLSRGGLNFSPNNFSLEIFIQNETTKILQLTNNGTERVTDIEISSNLSFIKTSKPKTIQPNESLNITLTFSPEETGRFQNYLEIEYMQGEKNNFSVPLNLFVLAPGDTINRSEKTVRACEDIGGIKCPKEKPSCDTPIIWAENEDPCCTGSCYSMSDKEESSGDGWIIGLLILVVISFLAYYLYLYQKRINAGNSKDKLEEVAERYKNRMSNKNSNRIKDGLSKS